MKVSECIAKAEYHRCLMNKSVKPLEKKLSKFLDEDITIFNQAGDGWCILDNDARNIPVRSVDFDVLFKMSKEDAQEYLYERRV